VAKLQVENKQLKESLSSIQAKQMIKECEHEINDQTVIKVKGDLKYWRMEQNL
jgi:quercetin dioxygenase-like cupin family protein